MSDPSLPPLTEWETFYVIVGSSAAALTGLMFVVIALGAEARRLAGERAVKAFGSPTVVHFCAVLLVSALVSMPGQTVTSLRICVLAIALAGLGVAIWVVVQARRQQSYKPVLSDWIWHTGLPLVAYLALFTAGVLVPRSPEPALDVVGASALLLLFIGIHNAWDAAVWMATQRRDEPPA